MARCEELFALGNITFLHVPIYDQRIHVPLLEKGIIYFSNVPSLLFLARK